MAHERFGFNYRLPDFSAALGLVQLSRLPELLEKRRRVARWYAEALADEDGVLLPPEPAAGRRPGWFVYVVQPIDAQPGRRSRVLEHLRAHGIGCSNYFPPIHLQPFYRERYGYQPGMFPVCERVAARTVALPFHTLLSQADVEEVVETLKTALTL
ncbi:DegT/DnrJ/EryC1/StrS family aminotransferase [bacterium]|nr:DegT/DnrJ/EryC1/StrS family aminotransferase [bacterium]